MELTKRALGFLCRRYRVILKKNHLLNTLGVMALAGGIAMGSVSVAAADDATIGSGVTVTTGDTVGSGAALKLGDTDSLANYRGDKSTSGATEATKSLDDTKQIVISGAGKTDANSTITGAESVPSAFNGGDAVISIHVTTKSNDNKVNTDSTETAISHDYNNFTSVGSEDYNVIIKDLEIADSVFSDAGGYDENSLGGAIGIKGGNNHISNVSIKNNTITNDSTIQNNAAVGNSQGAGFYQWYGSVTIDGSTFDSNKSLLDESNTFGVALGGGAAIFNATVNMDSVEFKSNQAIGNGVGRGGGLYLNSTYGGTSDTKYDMTATLKDVNFTGNLASTSGGALNAAGGENSTLTLSLTGGTFSGNAAGSTGGAINASTLKSLTLTDVTFTGNKVAAITEDSDKGTYVASENLTAYTAASDDASIAGVGGAIYSNNTDITINVTTGDLAYTGNDASKGGFLYLDGTSKVDFSVSSGASLTIGGADSATATADTIVSADNTATMTKTGTGTLDIKSDTTGYLGDLTVSAGVLQLATTIGDDSRGDITVSSGASLIMGALAEGDTASDYILYLNNKNLDFAATDSLGKGDVKLVGSSNLTLAELADLGNVTLDGTAVLELNAEAGSDNVNTIAGTLTADTLVFEAAADTATAEKTVYVKNGSLSVGALDLGTDYVLSIDAGKSLTITGLGVDSVFFTGKTITTSAGTLALNGVGGTTTATLQTGGANTSIDIASGSWTVGNLTLTEEGTVAINGESTLGVTNDITFGSGVVSTANGATLSAKAEEIFVINDDGSIALASGVAQEDLAKLVSGSTLRVDGSVDNKDTTVEGYEDTTALNEAIKKVLGGEFTLDLNGYVVEATTAPDTDTDTDTDTDIKPDVTDPDTDTDIKPDNDGNLNLDTPSTDSSTNESKAEVNLNTGSSEKDVTVKVEVEEGSKLVIADKGDSNLNKVTINTNATEAEYTIASGATVNIGASTAGDSHSSDKALIGSEDGTLVASISNADGTLNIGTTEKASGGKIEDLTTTGSGVTNLKGNNATESSYEVKTISNTDGTVSITSATVKTTSISNSGSGSTTIENAVVETETIAHSGTGKTTIGAEKAATDDSGNAIATASVTTKSLNISGGTVSVLNSIFKAETLKIDSGVFHIDPAYVAVDSLEDVNGIIAVSSGSTLNVGGTPLDPEELKKKGIDVTALGEGYIPTKTSQTLLVLGNGQTLNIGTTGKLIVDDMVQSDGNITGVTLATGTAAYFGDESTLLVDASKYADNASVIKFTDLANDDVTVTASANLAVMNAKVDQELTILDTAGTVAIAKDGWGIADSTQDSTTVLDSSDRMLTQTLNYTAADTKISLVSKLATKAWDKLSGAAFGAMQSLWKSEANDTNSNNLGVRFLSRAASNSFVANDHDSANAIESAIQVASLAGTPNIAQDASQAVYEALADRAAPNLKAGAENNAVKSNGVGIWFTPIYKSNNVNGMEAENFDYGFSSDLYGGTVGVDLTTPSNFRLGAALGIGTGQTYAQGDMAETENNFDFWNASIYAGYTYNNLKLMADLGYTSLTGEVDQDVNKNIGMSNFDANINAGMYTFGLLAEYTFNTEVVDIIPHLGVRYSSYQQEAFSLESAGGQVFSMEQISMDTWRIPVGVRFEKAFKAGTDWTIAPSLDLSYTYASNTDISNVARVGIANVQDFELDAQVFDASTFGVDVGLEIANTNDLSFGLSYGYQGSENRSAHAISLDARFEF